MNHDMTHCDGEGCMLRESCRRYHAHLEYQGDEGLKALMAVPYCEAAECTACGNRLYDRGHDIRATLI